MRSRSIKRVHYSCRRTQLILKGVCERARFPARDLASVRLFISQRAPSIKSERANCVERAVALNISTRPLARSYHFCRQFSSPESRKANYTLSDARAVQSIIKHEKLA